MNETINATINATMAELNSVLAADREEWLHLRAELDERCGEDAWKQAQHDGAEAQKFYAEVKRMRHALEIITRQYLEVRAVLAHLAEHGPWGPA